MSDDGVMAMSEPLYYLRDTRSNTGSNAVFWREDGRGYTTSLDEAETYPQSVAQRMHDARNTDVPLLAELVDAASIKAVDCQHLPGGMNEDSPLIGTLYRSEAHGMVTIFCLLVMALRSDQGHAFRMQKPTHT